VVQKIFNQILLPVTVPDLNSGAIEKAAAFANQMQCHLHVLCITVPSRPDPNWIRFIKPAARRTHSILPSQVGSLIEHGPHLMGKGLKFITSFKEDNIVQAIRAYTRMHNIDLILICNEVAPFTASKETRLTGDLASYINCPVLFSSAVPSIEDLKIIVLPVDEVLPVNKIRIAIYLASKFNAVIHLLAMQSKKVNYGDIDYLKRAYAALKENTSQPFVCQVLQNKNPGRAAVDYARSVHAGLVVTHPLKTGSFLYGVKSFFKKMYPGKREVPLMAVN
jgi:hypothetical protein